MSDPPRTESESSGSKSSPVTMPHIITTDVDGVQGAPATTLSSNNDQSHLAVDNSYERTQSRTSDTTYITSEKGSMTHNKEIDPVSPISPTSNATSEDSEQPEKPSLLRRIFPFLKKKEQVAYQPKADPSPEEMKPFDTSLTPSSLYNLIDPKNVGHLRELGGVDGILKGLGSDRKLGIQSSSPIAPEERTRVYGENRIPERKSKTLLQLMWAAYQDKVLLVLSVAAVVSLALGIYQSVGAPPKTYQSTKCPNNTCVEASVEWVEGVAITVAILIVVLVGSLNDYQKERQFRKLNAQKEERNVKVIRDGSEKLMSVYDVLVGDVLIIEPGEIIPVDGVMISGHNVRCDESGATGESDAVKKVPMEELGKEDNKKADPFLLSGAKVLEGVGSYVVTGVGEASFHGRIMMSLRDTGEEVTPLQLKLNALAELIAKIGSSAGLILFTALMIRFFVQLATNPNRTSDEKAQNFIQILIIAVTIVVVAVPEGLPLAVTLALAFATRRMTKMNLLVRVLGACETMANATVICTDKTGTLTTNQMTVVAGSVGVHLKFAAKVDEHEDRINANDDVGDEKAEEVDAEPRKGKLDFSTDMADVNKHLNPSIVQLLNDSIAINSTAFAGTDEHGKEGGFVGSKTETALLAFARDQGWTDYKTTRESAEIVQMIPFSSERKAMGCVVKLPGNAGYRMFLKGASEVLAKVSSRHVLVEENGANAASGSEIPVADFNDETRGNINRTIIFYANQSLRTIALCSRDMPTWPPQDARRDSAGEVEWADLARDLTLVAITAIEDPLRDGVPQAVKTCQGAGVQVKMCTGDNVLTARSIALQCGIFQPGGIIMEGPVFRKLSDADRIALVPRLQVLARSSPEDKKILVETLKGLGEVVGVTGDGTNDAPALNTANVGFSMGIAGTEVAKQASDIIIMDDSFKSIVSAIMWGRCVNDSVKKFLQFQISVNITAVVITFVTAVSSSSEESVLTAVQLLWVNLIMDTFAALALATDPATPESLERKPDKKYASLITPQMWMMIVGQAIFQIAVCLVLHFAGRSILGLHSGDLGTEIDQENELKTLVFNAFVWCQIFNMFNSRRLDRKLNIFTNIWKNWYFLVIFCIMAGGQALIVNVGGAAFQVVRINGRDWAISIIVGLVSIPLAVLIRLLPPKPFHDFMIKSRLVRDPNAPHLPTSSPAGEERHWNDGIDRVINNLNLYSTIRGGRLGSVKFVRAQRRKKVAKAGVQPTSLLAMVPTLVLSSVGAGWRPQGGSLFDPASTDPSKSTQQLVDGAIQAHPDTPEDDPVLTRFHAIKSPTHSRKVSVASQTTTLASPGGHSTHSSPQRR